MSETDPGVLMKKFRCGDVVPQCTRTFIGTQEEILAQVADHAVVDHQVEVTDELVQAVVRSIQPV